MYIRPTNPESIAVFDACLSASRDPNLYVVYYTTQGPTVTLVLDKSSIQSFNFTDTVCGDSNMTFGNIGSKSFSCKFYYSGTKPNLVTDANRYHRFDVYYTPKDSVVQARITSAGSANNYFATRIAVSNADDYLINLGTFFLDNYRFRNNVGEIGLVDCLGFLRSKVYRYDGGYAADPENPVIQYVVDEIATICDLHWISGNFGGALKMLFGETLKLYGASNWNGATCYDVLQQIAKACGGFVKSVPGNSISDIAFSILYGGNQLTQAAIPGFPYYNCNIEYDNVYSIKAAPSNADYLGARYLGNDCTYGTQLYVDVAQNDIWDGDISQYQTQAQQESRTQTLLQNIRTTCALPGFRPNRSSTVACPIYETLDIIGIALDANGYAGTIITTIKMSGLGKMEVSYAGDIDVQQNYITGGGQLSAGVRKNTSAINKLNDHVVSLEKYIDVGNNSLGIGEPAATSNIPANGRVDTDMDWHFDGDVYGSGGNIIKNLMYYPTSRVSISSAGWYRVFKWVTSDDISRAAQAFLADIAIATSYSNTANVVHRISLLGSYAPASGDVTAKKIIFANEVSKSYSNTNVITKIRYTTDGSGNGYIDIYYNDTSANYVKADIVQRPFFLGSWSDMGFASVASAPSGETVRAEYTFDSNYNVDDNTMYKSGDTATFGYLALSGGVYNSAKQLVFAIHMPKRMDKVSAPTITALKGILSGTNGTAEGSSSSFDWLQSAYTIGNIWKVNATTLMFRIDKSTAFTNLTNSTPVVLYATTLSLSFS